MSGHPVSVNSKNQVSNSPYTYDAPGNLTHDVLHAYTYDAESEITTVDGTAATYYYDAQGQRVQKANGNSYVYGLHGEVLAEYDSAVHLVSEYVYLGGRRIARRDASSGLVYYYYADRLGTNRVMTNASGTTQQESDYEPFGVERPPLTNLVDNKYKFTGLERDTESGLDHAWFRQYGSSFGRWLTPDPAGKGAVRLNDPQTWNMYAYVRNNPTTLTDPSGLYICNGTEAQCRAFEVARQNALASENTGDVRAARSYGDPGKDNGVNVGFAEKLKGDRGGTVRARGTGVELDPNNPTVGRAAVNVTIKSSNAGNEDVIVHEGSHVADRQGVVDALNRGDMQALKILNITGRESEIRAYQLSIGYAQRGNQTLNFGPRGLMQECKFPPGMMSAERDRLINDLLDSQYDKKDLNSVLFPGLP